MTIFGFEISTAILWLILAIVCLAIEANTVSLTTIWFAAGALLAMISSLIGIPLKAQIIIFLVASIILLTFTRKLFVDKLKTGKKKTNVDALIGEIGIVIEEIAPFQPGQVKVNGQMWKAVTGDDTTTISQQQRVKIVAIEGVKLIVTPV